MQTFQSNLISIRFTWNNIPGVFQNYLFRVFSDCVYFTQSRHEEVKDELREYINANSNIINQLLKSFQSYFEPNKASKAYKYEKGYSFEDYLRILEMQAFDKSFDLVFLAERYSRNLRLLCVRRLELILFNFRICIHI